MDAFETQIKFVNQNVKHFIDRFEKKLVSIEPAIDEEAVLRGSGKPGIKIVMDRLEVLSAQIDDLIEIHRTLAIEFQEAFEPTAILNAEVDRRTAAMKGQVEDFAHKARGAIGLVTLCMPECAFDLLEECRQQIHDMGKE